MPGGRVARTGLSGSTITCVVGAALHCLLVPLVLALAWALVPGGVTVLMLQDGPESYAGYAGRVRYRLAPRVR
jgi:hypothetical protein